jgi:hypothetical protein
MNKLAIYGLAALVVIAAGFLFLGTDFQGQEEVVPEIADTDIEEEYVDNTAEITAGLPQNDVCADVIIPARPTLCEVYSDPVYNSQGCQIGWTCVQAPTTTSTSEVQYLRCYPGGVDGPTGFGIKTKTQMESIQIKNIELAVENDTSSLLSAASSWDDVTASKLRFDLDRTTYKYSLEREWYDHGISGNRITGQSGECHQSNANDYNIPLPFVEYR